MLFADSMRVDEEAVNALTEQASLTVNVNRQYMINVDGV